MKRKTVSTALITMLLLIFTVSLSASAYGWWNSSWLYRVSITVQNPNSFALIEYPVNVTLDTQSLVLAGKMKSDGSDLRLLLNDVVEINFAVIDFNTANTKIAFKSSVPALGSTAYMLYYGNPLASDVSVSYEKIKYELIDEFNDGVIDPMWSFVYPFTPPPQPVPTHSESGGSLYLLKSTDSLAAAVATGLKINNSEILRVQFRAYSNTPSWAGYWGIQNTLYRHAYTYGGSGEGITFYYNTYDKSANVAGPWLIFSSPTWTKLSTEISASRIDWTQTQNLWYDYDVIWDESSNAARMTMNGTWYDNENTNGYFEDYSFEEFSLGVLAYVPSGEEYALFDYIRIWQEVSTQPTITLSYYLTVNVDPSGLTTIPGEGGYNVGDTPTLSAPSVVGSYRFYGWDIDGIMQGTTNPLSVLMNGDHTVTAHYSDSAVGGEWAPIDAVRLVSPWVVLALLGVAFAAAGSHRLLKKRL